LRHAIDIQVSDSQSWNAVMSRIDSVGDVGTGLIRESAMAVVYQCLDAVAVIVPRWRDPRLRDHKVRKSIAVEVDCSEAEILGVTSFRIEQSGWQLNRRSFCEVTVAIVWKYHRSRLCAAPTKYQVGMSIAVDVDQCACRVPNLQRRDVRWQVGRRHCEGRPLVVQQK